MPMSESLRIVIVQSDIRWKQVPENLKRYEHFLSSAQSADLILFPEMFATGFIPDPQSASDTTEQVLAWLHNMAGNKQSALIASHPVQEDDVYYNRLVSISPDGSEQYYDKRHLFSPGGEDKTYKAGSGQLITTVLDWKIMPLICYDLRFPVWSRNTVNYDILIYISNWPAPRDHIWEILLRARAIENQCYVIGVNRTGIDGRDIPYVGHSMIVGPDGAELGSLGSEEGLLEFELQREKLLSFRKSFPFLKDRDRFSIL
jgi:predicted amidohydrolase